MNAQIDLIEGTTRDLSKSQYFTPPELAERVVEWAGVQRGTVSAGWNPSDKRPMRVLEPSAGNGALVRPLVAAGAWVAAVEIDRRYDQELFTAGADYRIYGADFLKLGRESGLDTFDLCVMNCPYHDNGEMKFVLHALKFAPRVVGIFRADVFYSVTRGEQLWNTVRPTRVAFCSRRPFKGAETDYCVLELVKRESAGPTACTVEWWNL